MGTKVKHAEPLSSDDMAGTWKSTAWWCGISDWDWGLVWRVYTEERGWMGWMGWDGMDVKM
jgi:hypothetical protein